MVLNIIWCSGGRPPCQHADGEELHFLDLLLLQDPSQAPTQLLLEWALQGCSEMVSSLKRQAEGKKIL